MSENMNYKINFDEIASDFKYKEGGGLTHSQGNRYKLFPFVANDTTLFTDFSGVVGAFSRLISGKSLNESFDSEKFLENVADKIGEYEGDNSKETFRDIIRTMFLEEEKLVDFNIKTMNYIDSTSADEKIAKFIYSNMFSEDIKELVAKYYESNEENILYKIVLESLPELKSKKVNISEGVKYVEYVKELFIKDLTFIIQNEDLYKNSLKRVLEYYYMFYISQLTLKLSKFEKVDLNSVEPLYYTLSWESTSKNRTAYKFGWDLLKNSVSEIFAHAVTLELLNHHNLDKQIGYLDLFEIFNIMDEELAKDEINKLLESYKRQIIDVDWSGIKYSNKDSGNEAFNLVYKLFESVSYQFDNSARSRANEAYKNWYIKFVQANFGKRRGTLGYNLNLTEEDIILMTKLCINNNEKLKLNTLFKELELRGMYFDRDSKEKIVQLYEKLSLLEKKSDSGDAQYVRSIL